MQISDDIAVVGIAYKLPQDVEDDTAFWEVLEGARNLSSKWPEERMNADAHPDLWNGEAHSSGGHFIREDPASFDAPLFSVTAKEAASMDPVQRWTLEVSYRAFENAGIPTETLKDSRTAVLSATFTEDYIRMAAMDPDNVERTAATGCLASVIPNRVSYFFGMRGPSMHVDTACSSGLSAFDMACKVLHSGDAESALVTAANLILEPGTYQMFRNLQMLSPDSTCKTFDHKANGFGRGEGVLAFVLKPIAAALRDGDMIRAVVRGVASNQDGHTPALSQPNPVSQEDLIRHVYAQAGLTLEKTRYVEAHGTGTPVGDPIEMSAIGNAFRPGRSAAEPLYVGSVKSNIGHLEGASGLAGILKAILVLEKGIIPPNALFEKLNPAINAESLRVEVPNRCILWPSRGLRRVSVNGFGFGGSNTHVILDDAKHFLEERGLMGHHCTAATPLTNGIPKAITSGTTVTINGITNGVNDGTTITINGITNGTSKSLTNGITNGTTNGIGHAASGNHPKLLVFSAFDEKTTRRTLQAYSTWYQANNLSSQPTKVAALGYTLTARRSHMRWRSFAVANSLEDDLLEEKQVPTRKLIPSQPVRVVSKPSLGWVFTGQGAQYVNMGWELIDAYPVFEETLMKVNEVYRGLGCSWSIFDELRQKENINKPEYSQPLSTAIQLALVELLRSFGIVPKAVVGHSSGEIAAAYATGALSLVSACKVSYFRGLVAGKLRAAKASRPGSMISINLEPDQVSEFLSRIWPQQGTADIGIACINSPLNVTLSGLETEVDAVKMQADKEGIFAQKLKTGVAYHSAMMRNAETEYLALMGSLEPDGETLPIPMVSTVTGKMISPSDLATSQYWVDNMISPVKFATAVQNLVTATDSTSQGKITDFIEVGPHAALRRYVQDTLSGHKEKVHYSPALHRGHPASETILELAGTLFCRGHSMSLAAVNNQQVQATKGSMPPRFLVNLPSYPFDHSHKFWAESRISKDYRLRTATLGDALGQRVSDWNPLQPRWRRFLSVESHPWIGHHVVGDTVLYPAAGMLIMALEAAREMVPTGRTAAGYRVREAYFMNPAVVPEQWDDRLEMMTSLWPVKNQGTPQDLQSDWSDISIFTFSKKSHSWTEVFSASVQVQYTPNTTAERSETHMLDEAIRSRFHQAQETCALPVDSQLLYSDAAEYGLQYGEWFQLCQDIRWDKSGHQAVASVPVTNAVKFKTASVVHPAVLDTAFHVLRVSAGQQHAANVPVRLADAWFASSGWQVPETGSIRWLASSKNPKKTANNGKAARGEQGNVCALADDGTVLANIEMLATAAVSSTDEADPAAQPGAEKKKLLYGIEWNPQLSLLSPEQLARACNADTFPGDEETVLAEHRQRTAVLNIVAVRHVKNTMRVVLPKEKQRANLNSTLRHHMDWMEHHVRSLPAAERQAAEALTEEEFEAQLDSFASAFPSWTLYPHVARSLPAIFTGDVDPLQVIFESDHAKTFYASLFHTVCGDGRLSKFLDLAAHETPSLRILEVGAGTGGMTVHILNALKEREKRTGTLAFEEFMYTDISPVFFEAAKARWADDSTEGVGSRMVFKTLDMENPVSAQGFKEGSYDLLIAGSCVHATGSLDKTLQNLRRLLKPGGKLVMLEVTDPTDIATCFFATLASGWWLSEEEWRIKNKSPLASEDAWDGVLKENGFSGNDLVLRDTGKEESHIVSVIVSTAIEKKNIMGAEPGAPKRVFVVDAQQKSQEDLANVLSKSNNGRDIVLPLDHITSTAAIDNADDVIVSLVEVDKPFLADVSEMQFAQLQSLVKQARNLVWVTAPPNGADDAMFPHYSIAQGFLRTVRAEMADSCIVSLAIEDNVPNAETRAYFINATVKTAFESTASGGAVAPEREYVVRSGQMHTARAVEEVSANTTVRSLLSPRLQQLAWKSGPAVKLGLATPRSLDSLCFEQDETHNADIELGPREVEIEAHVWGLGRQDVLAALGRLRNSNHDYDSEDAFGTYCSGVVTRVGSDCVSSQKLQPGDRVGMLSRGCTRKFPRADESRVLKMRSQLQDNDTSFEMEIAALEPGVTAYHALLEVARVAAGDKVLVHEAASATGQMAVQIAKTQGAEVFVTTSALTLSSAAVVTEREEKERNFLADTLGVEPEHIFSSSNNTTSFAQGIRHITEGYGVDIVISTLTGDQARASWQLLAPCGRFVVVGQDSESVVDLSMAMSGGSSRRSKNTSFATVDVHDLRPQVITRLIADTMAYLRTNNIPPPALVRVFPATEAKETFKALQNETGAGGLDRVIMTAPRPDDVVPQLVLDPGTRQPRQLFNEDASYLVPGGLGGVGRAILTWMAERGAKHLIVPSRSGASSSTAAATLVSSLQSRGVHIVTPKCNVASEVELAALLEESKQTMPPIRGVINCAMVLTNALFANMSYQQWSSAIQAKVAGSFNLHRLLWLPAQDQNQSQNKTHLDFFVHLASLAGVNGQMASANYTAGCAFQDALSRSCPGVTALDVGWMADVGLIAETAAYQRQLKDWGNMQRVEERELLGVLSMVCDAGRQRQSTERSIKQQQQLLVGLLTPADYLAKGKEPPPTLSGKPFLSTFAHAISPSHNQGSSNGSKNGSSAAKAVNHAALFRAAPDSQTRKQIVTTALAEKLARAMMISADEVDPDRSLSAYGIDSLMAMELRRWIVREFGANLSMWEMMSREKGIKGIVDGVVMKSKLVADSSVNGTK